MSVFSALFDKNARCFEQVFSVQDTTSSEMQRAIRGWFALYFEGGAPKEEDDCQRLPVVIVNKLTKAVFSEYEADVKTQGAKADFVRKLLDCVDRAKKSIMQQALVGGECFIKPILTAQGLGVSVIRRDCFIPLERDGTGAVTSVGTSEETQAAGRYYTLLERRTVDEAGTLTIESKLFESVDKNTLGVEVPLAKLDQYAALQPVLELPGMYSLGMALVKTPLMNCVDGSQDGVSVYAPAVGLIRNINRNERLLDREFENGASRILVSADMLESSGDGQKRLTNDVFEGIDDDPDNIGITIFSPALREASYLARKQEYLRNVESAIGLKRGILSEVEAAERTATEITSSEGDYNLTVIDFQTMWADALKSFLTICDRLGQHYKLCDSSKFDPETDLVIDWGDGVLFNRDKVWQEYQTMVASGMLKPELALAWYFNLPHETEKDLQKIRTNYMPEMEALVGGDA